MVNRKGSSLSRRRNYLLRVGEVQELYRANKTSDAVTDKGIWRNTINPRYHIGYATFLKYLGISVNKELAKIQH